MLYREYGKTGKKVSVLGFGCMRFPGELVSTEEGRELCSQLVIRANELGINLYDTTHEYCGGHSEEILGNAFRRMKGEFFVSSKSGLQYDPDGDSVRRRVESSLKTLGLEKINFFHMWRILNIEQYHKIMAPGGPYEGARKAKEEGLIEHICFSTHCTGEEIEEIIKDDVFEGMILGYNLLNSSYRQQGLNAAYKKGIGVAVMNPLAGGVIPRNAEYFKKICRNDESAVEAALRFVISSPGVTCALSGISTLEELEENVACIDRMNIEDGAAGSMAVMDVGLQFNDLCTGCNYCAGCPEGIEISKLMLAYNQSIIKGGSTAELGNSMHEWWNYGRAQQFPCIQCGACEKKCTQHLPIIKRIEEINEFAVIMRNRATENFVNLVGGETTVGLYAIGGLAKTFLKEAEECEFHLPHIEMFDGDDRKWGKEIFEGYVVKSPDKIKDSGIKRVIICVQSEDVYKTICDSLKTDNHDIKLFKYTPVLS